MSNLADQVQVGHGAGNSRRLDQPQKRRSAGGRRGPHCRAAKPHASGRLAGAVAAKPCSASGSAPIEFASPVLQIGVPERAKMAGTISMDYFSRIISIGHYIGRHLAGRSQLISRRLVNYHSPFIHRQPFFIAHNEDPIPATEKRKLAFAGIFAFPLQRS